ncbi:exodeoxyribonuclease VII small subunit [Actinomyces israelii]|uniref:exodeoxyribonuclease VII small subunit n=1 Tax=Actinomyces israelii TaxID=1659 RepID=UPI0005BCB38B|nr:exodeoxyribonuclease VII small subunit [Actinomyces israelii]WKR20729.1 Exodeoxyribonuclease 7 small subunit [Actinomyces israelii]
MSLSSPTGATDPPNGSSDANADVATLSYERAREELVSVVQHLEAGQVPLEEALTLWERGEALAARCQAWLDDARARLAAVAEREKASS